MKQNSGFSTALTIVLLGTMIVSGVAAIPKAHATTPFFFSTGSPDGLIGMASRPPSGPSIEIEAADDFVLSSTTTIASATFVGLLPIGVPLSDASQVVVEIYRVFPLDSTAPPSGNVPSRVNSPSDNALDQRDSSAGELSYTSILLSDSFTVANTVVNGIYKIPNQFTGGEGATTRQEVQFSVTFTTPFILPMGHYFFVPQVHLSSGATFLWLSAPKPITGGTGPFTSDLQTWIRNANLDPDWLRVGTDITHQGPFNGAFSLSGTITGTTVPEFQVPAILMSAISLLAVVGLRRLQLAADA